MTETYSLFYSKQHKQKNEREYKGLLTSSGSYQFVDLRTNKQYEVTEFVSDRYFLGFLCFPGKSIWADAELILARVPAECLRRITHK